MATYPPALKEMDIWVAWQLDEVGRKRPRAPWLTDHCYPVPWGADADERPEADFETVTKYTQLEPYEFEAMGLEFEDGVAERRLETGLILPHEPPDPPVMQIDLDDVRNPETGELHPDAIDIIKRADSYASVSTSGEGVHCMVRAGLPEEYGKYIAPIDDSPWIGDSAPQVEMYDHGRHVALTGKHLDITPEEMTNAQDTVDWINETYESATRKETETAGNGGGIDDYLKNRTNQQNGSGDMSRYYEEPLTHFAEPKANVRSTTQGVQGAHPTHGGTSSADSESTNYHINTDTNVWHCFAHDSGGGPLSMVAVMEGELGCADCGGSGTNALDELTDQAFLRVCLAARDKYGFSGDPPYRALVGLAKAEGLSIDDPKKGILGWSTHTIATSFYEDAAVRDYK